MKVTVLESLQHPLVKHLVKLKENARYRQEVGSVVIEGKTLVEEVTAEHPAKVVIATEGNCDPQKYRAEAYYQVSEAILKKVTGTVNPEGVVAEVVMPAPSSLDGAKRLLVLDRISDPGNMGTLLRTALAFGWDGAYLLDGCCDPYNDKALRAAKGATFRLPWRKGSWEAFHAFGEEQGMAFLAADLEGKEFGEGAADGNKAMALVLGNEAQGVSEEVLRDCQKVTIPMVGKMESLNVSVAGGIMMYYLRKSDD